MYMTTGGAFIVTHPDGSVAIAMPPPPPKPTRDCELAGAVATLVVFLWVTGYTYMLLYLSSGAHGRCESYERPCYLVTYSAVIAAVLVIIVVHMNRLVHEDNAPADTQPSSGDDDGDWLPL